MHIFLLTNKPFNIDTLPYAIERTIHKPKNHPDDLTMFSLQLEVRRLLSDLGQDFSLLSKVFIVVEPTANSIALMFGLVFGLAQVSITPEIWIIENEHGMYLGIQELMNEGVDWAMKLHQIKLAHAKEEAQSSK